MPQTKSILSKISCIFVLCYNYLEKEMKYHLWYYHKYIKYLVITNKNRQHLHRENDKTNTLKET